jgi:hypothetical protein
MMPYILSKFSKVFADIENVFEKQNFTQFLHNFFILIYFCKT